MFKEDFYYIHQYGKDAVIRVHDVKEYESGYEMNITWHTLSYRGEIYSSVAGFQFVFISKEHAKEWTNYAPGDRSYA